MRLLNPFGEARYHLREKLVDNRFSVFLAGLFGRNFTKLFVKNEEEGYSRIKDDVKIKMTRSVHFTDIILRKPLEGYKKSN